MDCLLYKYCKFIKTYIDNVIVQVKIFEKHILHLQKVFGFFSTYNISIKPSKTFLRYTKVNLFGKQVNLIGLSSSESRLEAISKFLFLHFLA